MNIEFDLKNQDLFPRERAAVLWGSAAFSFCLQGFWPKFKHNPVLRLDSTTSGAVAIRRQSALSALDFANPALYAWAKSGGRMTQFWLATGVALGIAGPAQAHPHIFIDTGLELIFDSQGRAEAVRIAWTYDDLTSLAMLSDRGMDEDFDGVLTPAELTALNGFDMQWEPGISGDTYALLGAASLNLSRPSDWSVSYADAKITSTHLRRFDVPVVIGADPLVVQVYDTSYYTAYAIVGDTVVTGAPGCVAQAFAPDREAADQILQNSIAEMAGGDAEGDFPAIGAAYAEEVRVTCNAPS